MKKDISDFRAGDIFKYKGKGPTLEANKGIAIATSIGDDCVKAEGKEGYYNPDAGSLSFSLDYFDLFLEEEVFVEEEEEIPTREPGVWMVGDIVQVLHLPGSDDWGHIKVESLDSEGKIEDAVLVKNTGGCPWVDNSRLAFGGLDRPYNFKLIEGVDE